jgi:hypothetical protein
LEIDYNNNTFSNENLSGRLIDKECNLNLQFHLKTEKEEYSSSKIVLYSILASFMGLVQICNSIWLTHKITGAYSASNTISLFSVGQSIIWNTYGCLFNFVFSVQLKVIINFFTYLLLKNLLFFLFFFFIIIKNF